MGANLRLIVKCREEEQGGYNTDLESGVSSSIRPGDCHLDMESVKLLVRPRRLYHPKPHVQFKGRWQKEEEDVSLWYLIYQLIACSFLLGNLITDWVDSSKDPPDKQSKYLIYLTHWGIVTLNLAVLLETILTIFIFFKIKSEDKPGSTLHSLLHFSWGISHATYSAAVFITALYWPLLYNEDDLSYFNVYKHGMQGAYSVLDQMISARNWEGGHWWVCLPLPLLYLIFSVIYWAAGGTNDKGQDYIYDVLDWEEKPGEAVALAAGALALLVVIHYLFAALTWVRDRIHRACCCHKQVYV